MKGKFATLFHNGHYMLQLWNNPLIGFSLTDENGVFTDLNKAYCAILCRSYDDIVGASWHDFTLEDDKKSDEYLCDGVLKGQLQSYEMRKRYKVHNDHFIEVIIGVRAIRDPDGRFVCFYTTCVPLDLIIGSTNLSVSYFHDQKLLVQDKDPWDARVNMIYRIIGIILGGSAVLGGIGTAVYYLVKLVDLVIGKVK